MGNAFDVQCNGWSVGPQNPHKVKQAWHPSSNPSTRDVETEAGQLERPSLQVPAYSERPFSLESQFRTSTHRNN